MIVYHYFKVEMFENFFKTNKLSLTQICQWNKDEDSQKEGAAFNWDFTRIRNYYSLPDEISQNMLYGLKRAYYAQCWTVRPHDIKMWEKFSPDRDGVCVSIDSNVIYECMKKSLSARYEIFDLREVMYIPQMGVSSAIFDDNTDFSRFAECFVDKSTEFEYEKEYRYIAYKKNIISEFGNMIIQHSESGQPWNLFDLIKIRKLTNENVKYIYYEIPFSSVVEVIVDPRMSADDYDKLALLCANHRISCKFQ